MSDGAGPRALSRYELFQDRRFPLKVVHVFLIEPAVDEPREQFFRCRSSLQKGADFSRVIHRSYHAELLESLAAALRESLLADECRRLAGLLSKEQS